MLPFSVADGVVQTFSFAAPPGLREIEIPALEAVRSVSIAGRDVFFVQNDLCRVCLSDVIAEPAEVIVTTDSSHGCLGGAVFDGPIRVHCERGLIRTGDWSRIGGMKDYAGGVAYTQRITLTQEQTQGRVQLRMDDVCASEEVLVNGRSAGIRVAPPWQWEAAGLLRPGENTLTVQVYSSLANHYEGIPARYRGNCCAGLQGGVKLLLEAQKP